MLEDVRSQGAAAARSGLTIWDCPYLLAHEMPAHTGEPFREWTAKVQAWEEGWNQVSSQRVEEQGARSPMAVSRGAARAIQFLGPTAPFSQGGSTRS